MNRSLTLLYAVIAGAALMSISLPSKAFIEDTTPFQCERLTIANTGNWIAPILRASCERSEGRNVQTVAKRLGKPRPSAELYDVPALGTRESKRTGLACIGGTVMQRLSNGWQQLRDQQNNWLRCRDL